MKVRVTLQHGLAQIRAISINKPPSRSISSRCILARIRENPSFKKAKPDQVYLN